MRIDIGIGVVTVTRRLIGSLLRSCFVTSVICLFFTRRKIVLCTEYCTVLYCSVLCWYTIVLHRVPKNKPPNFGSNFVKS